MGFSRSVNLGRNRQALGQHLHVSRETLSDLILQGPHQVPFRAALRNSGGPENPKLRFPGHLRAYLPHVRGATTMLRRAARWVPRNTGRDCAPTARPAMTTLKRRAASVPPAFHGSPHGPFSNASACSACPIKDFAVRNREVPTSPATVPFLPPRAQFRRRLRDTDRAGPATEISSKVPSAAGAGLF